MGRGLYVFIFILSAGCATVSDNPDQGIRGKTLWVTGNRMPGPETNLPDPEPVRRWVYVTPVIEMSRMPDPVDGVYAYLPVDPVDSVESSKKGIFTLGLSPGTYSVFTKEPDGYFANRFDETGHVNPVTVIENKITDVTIEINYTAVY